jgi:hypothetical protein
MDRLIALNDRTISRRLLRALHTERLGRIRKRLLSSTNQVCEDVGELKCMSPLITLPCLTLVQVNFMYVKSCRDLLLWNFRSFLVCRLLG